jgi:tRNA/rRNA methyltransferase
MSSAHEKITDGQTVGILFGGERAGMDNDDIALSSAIITLPLNQNFTSLNLAQAVLLVAYEFMAQADATPPKQTDLGKTDIATAETVENFTARLIDELSDARFFRSDDLRPTTERNLRNLFTRLNLTDQDVQTFHGILSAFVKKN